MSLSGSPVYEFVGGVHPPHSKEATEASPIEVMPPPSIVVIPLQQHIGAPCKAVVKMKDEVKRGQIIGEAGGFVSALFIPAFRALLKKWSFVLILPVAR